MKDLKLIDQKTFQRRVDSKAWNSDKHFKEAIKQHINLLVGEFIVNSIANKITIAKKIESYKLINNSRKGLYEVEVFIYRKRGG